MLLKIIHDAHAKIAVLIALALLATGCPDGSPFEAEVPAEPDPADDDDATDVPADDDDSTPDSTDDDDAADDDDATADDDDAVANQAPDAPVLSIAPANPLTLDDLSLLFQTHSEDPDGDPVTYSIQWMRDASPVASLGGDEMTPSDQTTKGEIWRAEVVASDGTLSSDVAFAEVVIGNSPPVIEEVLISPSLVQSDGDASCAATWSDPDGDDAVVELSWTVDGIDPGVTTDLITNEVFEREDELICFALVTDDDGAASEGEADASVVANTPPGPPEVQIDQPSNDVEIDLLCEVAVPSVDFEGDEVEYSYQWLLDGQPTAYTDAVLPASATDFSQNWSCVATPFDGFDAGTPSAPYGLTTCDGAVYYEDNDGDGYGDPIANLTSCVQPPDTSTLPHDCDDDDEQIFPEAGDTVGDGIDQDCDGRDCEAGSDGTTYWAACGMEADWTTAQDLCVYAGLMYDGLARVTSEAELLFLSELVAAAEFDDFGGLWLGLSDSATEGDWLWWDDSPAIWTAWTPEGPADDSGDEDCGQLLLTGDQAGSWTASDCNDSQSLDAGFTGYVCEMR